MSTTLEEKLAEFSAAVLAEAQRKRAEFEAENEEIKSRKIDSVQDEYLNKAYSIIQSGISEIKKADNERVLSAQNASRRELLLKRESIIDEVFNKAAEKLKAFTQTEAYTEWLEKKLIQSVRLAGKGDKVVYARQEDEAAVTEAIAKMPTEDGSIAFERAENSGLWGGIKLKNTVSNILIDYSLEELLASARADFLQKSGLRID